VSLQGCEPNSDITGEAFPGMAASPSQGGSDSAYCTTCGSVLQPGKAFCSRCGTLVGARPAGAPSVPPPSLPLSRDDTIRNVVTIVVVVVVIVAVVLVVLFAVPFPERETYAFQGIAPAAGFLGCSSTLIDALSFPGGETVHLSWTTTPSTTVEVDVLGTQSQSMAFSGTGDTGSGSFSSTGGDYWFSVDNCDSQDTSVAFSAYYNVQAPIL